VETRRRVLGASASPCSRSVRTRAARRTSRAAVSASTPLSCATMEASAAGGQLTPFVVYGFGGSRNDFSDVRFPGDLRDCAKCHINNSQELPVPAGRVNVVNPQAWYSPMGPMTAACTACHTQKSTAAHTSVNTSPQFGESCDVCHGVDADFSVDKVHARTL